MGNRPRTRVAGIGAGYFSRFHLEGWSAIGDVELVGWCDGEGNGEWVVTIRCGLIHKNRIRLFAGAGIVEDSCPESEWAETQAKLQTMLNALGVELPRVGVHQAIAEIAE